MATPMATWKTDPLYRRILDEARALWHELPLGNRPDLLRIEQRAMAPWHDPEPSGRLIDVWVIDDADIRLAPILRREEHEFGSARGEYHRFGLIRFAITPDRRQVVLDYRLGPEIGGEIVYSVEGEGEGLYLLAETGTLSV